MIAQGASEEAVDLAAELESAWESIGREVFGGESVVIE